MIGKMLILLAFSIFVGEAFGAQRIPNWLTFYEGRATDKESYIAKLESPDKLRLSSEEVLASANKAFGKNFGNMAEYKSFVRSSDVTVVRCSFTKSAVEHLEERPRVIGTNIRDAKSGEVCLHYEGGDRIILDCGQGIADVRRVVKKTPPKPAIVPAPSAVIPPPPPLPRERVRVVEVERKKVCETIVESNPSPPIAVGNLVGVYNRGTGVTVGSSMSVGASHRQEYQLCR